MATPPVIATEKLQYGVQSAIGTSVAATRVVDSSQGTINYRPDMRSIVVRNSGTFANANRGYAGQTESQVDYAGSATFNRLADDGALFWDKVSTGTGSGSTRTWTFTPSDTTDNLARYTFEYGGTNFPSATGYVVQDCVGWKWDLSVKPNESWQVKRTVIGTIASTGTITGALSLPSTLQNDDVLWTQSTVYIDPTSNNYGTTVQTGRIVSVDFSLQNGLSPRHTLDGVTYPTSVVLAESRQISAKIVMHYDTQTPYTDTFASTPQRVQIRATGPNSRSAKINISGYWDALVFGNDNGVKTLEMTLKSIDDSSISSDAQLIVVNGVTTLTTIP